jgi:hypothetical protein
VPDDRGSSGGAGRQENRPPTAAAQGFTPVTKAYGDRRDKPGDALLRAKASSAMSRFASSFEGRGQAGADGSNIGRKRLVSP